MINNVIDLRKELFETSDDITKNIKLFKEVVNNTDFQRGAELLKYIEDQHNYLITIVLELRKLDTSGKINYEEILINLQATFGMLNELKKILT